MALTYITDGDWGIGKGAPLTPAEFDTNTYELANGGPDISEALATAAAAQATADGKIQTFYSPTPPTAEGTGDLWFDVSDDNKLYRWSGAAWVDVQSSTIAAALQAAADAQATADGKVTTFFQDAAPVADMAEGDLWFDTNDSNKMYRYSGAAWVSARDAGISAALSAASGAQSTADGKITTFYQDAAPTVGMDEGDLWIDKNDGNKLYVRSSGVWIVAQDQTIGTAITNAATAQATADGKVVSFYAASGAAPTPEGVGDLWYQTDTKLTKRWSGTTWQSTASYNTGALANLDTVGTTQIQQGAASSISFIDGPIAPDAGGLGVWQNDAGVWHGSGWMWAKSFAAPDANGISGVLLDLDLVMSATPSTEINFAVGVWSIPASHVKLQGAAVTPNGPGLLNAVLPDLSGSVDFNAVGIVAGDLVYVVSDNGLVLAGAVQSITDADTLEIDTTATIGTPQMFIIVDSAAPAPVNDTAFRQHYLMSGDVKSFHANLKGDSWTGYTNQFLMVLVSRIWSAADDSVVIPLFYSYVRALLLKR